MLDASHDSAPEVLVVELIGDLDATLGQYAAETIATHAAKGAPDIVLSTKHLSLTSEIGMRTLDAAIRSARDRGHSVSLDPGTRKMGTAFNNARIAYSPPLARPRAARCLMIARHAAPKRSTKAA